MNSRIIALVKCKANNLSDINNYRAITLSTAITKILENVLLQYVNDKVDVDRQFGFKAGHSTTLCTLSFKHTVQYTCRGSHVLICFADVIKAIDRVNYSKLFR